MKLPEFLTSILKFADVDVEDNRFKVKLGTTQLDDSFSKIEGKYLVLPTQDNLRNTKPDELPFHPLNESIVTDKISIYDQQFIWYNHKLQLKLNFLFGQIANTFLTLVKTNLKDSLDFSQISELKNITDVDDKTTGLWLELMTKMKEDPTIFFNILVKKGVLHNGVRESGRGCVSSPLLDNLRHLKTQTKGPYKLEHTNKEIRKKDIEIFVSLYETIFGKNFGIITEESVYDVGTTTDIAPKITALLLTANKVAITLFGIYESYKTVLPTHNGFDTKWTEVIEERSLMRKICNEVLTIEPVTDSNIKNPYNEKPRDLGSRDSRNHEDNIRRERSNTYSSRDRESEVRTSVRNESVSTAQTLLEKRAIRNERNGRDDRKSYDRDRGRGRDDYYDDRDDRSRDRRDRGRSRSYY